MSARPLCRHVGQLTSEAHGCSNDGGQPQAVHRRQLAHDELAGPARQMMQGWDGDVDNQSVR